MDRPTVSEHDRQYFRRIGEYKKEAAADRLRWHLSMPGLERLESVLRQNDQYLTPERIGRSLAGDDPSPLYERARKLGLIRE